MPTININTELKKLIKGQDAAIDKITPYIDLYNASLLGSSERPIATFMLSGPTGVGKTETVHALAKILHGDRANVLRIDCGEYAADHEVSRLIGAPPGYIGHAETNAVLTAAKISSVVSANCPIAIILFDELEKASPRLQQLLLGIFDRGVLQLGTGAKVYFSNCLIFCTSNVGAQDAVSSEVSPYTFAKVPFERTTNKIFYKHFSPEFINRIDEFITFAALDKNILRDICSDLLSRYVNVKKVNGVKVNRKVRIHLAVLDNLVESSTSIKWGARELLRTIRREILIPLATKLLKNDMADDDQIVFALNDENKIVLEIEKVA